MPIFIKNPSKVPPKPVESIPKEETPPTVKETPISTVEETPESPSENTPEENAELLAQKRAARAQRRTRYQVVRKDKTAKDYKDIKLTVGGEEQQMSDSSKFMLDMLIKDEKPT